MAAYVMEAMRAMATSSKSRVSQRQPSPMLALLLLLGLLVRARGAVFDAGYMVAMIPFPASGDLSLSNLDIQRATLYPASSDYSFLPAIYMAPTSPATLKIVNSTITTECSIQHGYATWLQSWVDTGSLPQGSGNQTLAASSVVRFSSDGNTIVATRLSWSSSSLAVTLTGVTLTCSASQGAAPVAQITASNTTELQTALTTLATLNISEGSEVQLSGTVSTAVSQGWPLDGILLHAGQLYFSSGSDGRAVLDLDMAVGAINVTTGPVYLTNVTLANICTPLYNVQGYYMYTSYLLYGLGRPDYATGSGIKTLYATNTTLVVLRQEVSLFMYWTAFYPSPFAGLAGYAAVFTRSFANMPPLGVALNPNQLLVTLEFSSLLLTDVLLVAADTPPEEARNVTIQPPTQCGSGGSTARHVLPDSVLKVNILYPIWTATSTAELSAGLAAAVQEQYFYFPPMFMVFNSSAMVPPRAGTAWTFGSDTIIVGPSTQQTADGNPTGVVLDLQQTPAASASLSGKTNSVYLQRLTLKGLVTAPLAGAGAAGNTQVGASALPLWAFQFNRTNTSVIRIQLDSVTLILPVASFAPLYALAKSGGPKMLANSRAVTQPVWSALMDPTLDGLTDFTVRRYDNSSIVLSFFSGWGVNGTNVVLQPDAPYLDDQPVASPGQDSSTSLSTTAIILIAVFGFVFVVLVVALGFAYRYYAQRRKQAALNESASLSAKAAGVETMKEGSVAVDMCRASSFDRQANSSDRITDNTPTNGSIIMPSNGSGNMPSDGSGSGPATSAKDGAAATSGAVAVAWDPMKEVQQLAGTVQLKEEDSLQLLEAIGSGGFGTVYRGRWRNLDVAVKTVLFTTKDGGEDAPERQIVKEAAVCSTVIHPNVVATYHYDIRPVRAVPAEGSTMQITDPAHPRDWKMYLVQELCHASLADALVSSFFHDRPTKLPYLDLILRTLDDVAAGLDYIHGKNIIHGDLKPENVLLKMEPGRPHGIVGKIIDFGLCSTLDPAKSHVSCFNGTPFYAAPEITTTGKATKASDVFSFGILMVEVYRQVPPWVHTPHGYQVNQAFLVFTEKVPAAYAHLVDQCLARDPKKRPEMFQVRAALQGMIATLLSPPAQASKPAEQGTFALTAPGPVSLPKSGESQKARAAAAQHSLGAQPPPAVELSGGMLPMPPV